MKKVLVIVAAIALGGCAIVRQVDLDAWKGMPVEALDTHSFFLTVPMYKTFSESGIEIRNYANGAEVADCFGSGTASSNRSGRSISSTQFATCTSQKVVCNNIFYIKDGRVLEYAPTGRCMTNETVQPQKRYLELMRKG